MFLDHQVVVPFSCTDLLTMKLIMLTILTFMSIIITTSESLVGRKAFLFQHFSFYEQLKFHVKFIKNEKFYNLGDQCSCFITTLFSAVSFL